MKKIKCLLMVSLIVILAMGVFTACTEAGDVDREVYPHLVTYCANGGDLNGKTERYLYMQDEVHAIEPSSSDTAMVRQPTYAGYKFLGWAKGKVDENGNPVLLDSPKYRLDGGVWMTDDGAVTAEVAKSDSSSVLKYYDYDAEDLWDFNNDIVTENVVLVAVWGEYSKFIFANKDGDAWEDLSDLVAGNVGESDPRYEGYQARLYDVTGSSGTKISIADITNAYAKQFANRTAIRYYADPDMTKQVVGNKYEVTSTITVVYCLDIEGDYTIVTSASDFKNALTDNENIYLDANLDMSATVLSMDFRTYTGSIEGANHKLTCFAKTEDDTWKTISQAACAQGEQNTYGAFLGALSNSTISNLNIEMTVTFQICVNPDPEGDSKQGEVGTERDAKCYLGFFAKSMSGCTLKNVNVSVEYEITRSTYIKTTEYVDGKPTDIYEENAFEVDVIVGDWQAIESADNVIGDDCSITVTKKDTASK